MTLLRVGDKWFDITPSIGPSSGSVPTQPVTSFGSAAGQFDIDLAGASCSMVILGHAPEAKVIDELVTDLWLLGDFPMRYRIWAVWQDFDEHGDDRISFQGVTYERLLNRRLFGAGGLLLNNVDVGTVVWNAIQHTQAKTGGGLGVTQGHTTTGITTSVDWLPGENIGARLEELMKAHGCYWRIDENKAVHVYVRDDTVDNFMSFVNGEADRLTVPNSTELNVSGDLEVIWRANLPAWSTGGTAMAFVSKGFFAWEVITYLGNFYFAMNGANQGICAVANLGVTNGVTYWFRMVRNGTNGAVDWYVQPDSKAVPTSWGTAKTKSGTQSSAAINASSYDLTVGARPLAGPTWGVHLTGSMFDVIVKNGATTVFEMRYWDLDDEGFIVTSGQPATPVGVTVNRNATIPITEPVMWGVNVRNLQRASSGVGFANSVYGSGSPETTPVFSSHDQLAVDPRGLWEVAVARPEETIQAELSDAVNGELDLRYQGLSRWNVTYVTEHWVGAARIRPGDKATLVVPKSLAGPATPPATVQVECVSMSLSFNGDGGLEVRAVLEEMPVVFEVKSTTGSTSLTLSAGGGRPNGGFGTGPFGVGPFGQ